MNLPKTNQTKVNAQADFWDDLWTDIMISNTKLTQSDVKLFVEHSFIFSLFFRGCSQLEILGFQTLLNIKDIGYLVLLELSPSDRNNGAEFSIDEVAIYHHLKKVLKNTNNAIGPQIMNRISILITDDKELTNHNSVHDSITLGNTIIRSLREEFNISAAIGIGSVQNSKSFYTSFIEALTCMHYSNPEEVLHIHNLKKKSDSSYEYNEAVKYMMDALRFRKIEAYDYFSLLMDSIKFLNDEMKRNKIIEILVLANHSMRLDRDGDTRQFSFTGHLSELLELEGNQLIEWAFQKFIYITGYVKPQNSIDYTNKIVQATKEYLEAHYAEEISLEDMAAQVNISPQYFSKLIKKTTGFNFIDWLSMLRVKKAKELLSNSNLTVKEVCFLVGYKDPNYFSRIFKKRIGITPSDFVKNNTYSNS